MGTTVVNYAEFYYSKRASQKIPERYSGKFVQLMHNDNEYLVFSPKEFSKYHANIVEHFSKERGLGGAYNTEKRHYDLYEDGWIITGGKFEIDTEKKELRLYDDSMAYGRFNDEGLKERLLNSEEFSGFTIVIE